MEIENLTAVFSEKCRACGTTRRYDTAVPEGCDVAVACHEALEGEGWADGICPACLERTFLTPGDKADHENKTRKEIDI
jgi:hypothetical protein